MNHISKKILFVTDKFDFYNQMIKTLRQGDFTFEQRLVNSVETFNNQIVVYNPDLIIFDCTIPYFDPTQATKILSNQSRKIPFLPIYDEKSEDVALYCLSKGFSKYVVDSKLNNFLSIVKRSVFHTIPIENADGSGNHEITLIDDNGRTVIVTGLDWVIKEADLKLERNFDYEVSKVIGKRITDYLLPESRNMVKQIIEEEIEFEKRKTIDQNHNRKVFVEEKRDNGSVIESEVSLRFLRSEDGHPENLLVVRNVSFNNFSLKTLSYQKEYFQFLFDNISFGIVLVNVNDVILEYNKAFKSMFLFDDNAEIIGKKLDNLVVPESMLDESMHLNDSAFSGKQMRMETIRKRQDGTLFYVLAIGYPLVLPDGNRVTFVTYIDISERKETEKELTYERSLLQSLMDNIPDTIYFKDTNSSFIRINKAQETILGVEKAEDAIGKSDVDFFDSEFAKRTLADENRIMTEGFSIINDTEYVQTAKGWKYFSSNKVPFRNQEGKIVGLVGVSRDITELKELENSLLESQKRLQEMNAEKDKLFSIIAHDLRGPFNTFLALTESFGGENDLGFSDEDIKDIITSIHKSAVGMASLLDNLLNWSQVQRNLKTISKIPIKLNEFVEKVFDTYEQSLKKKNIGKSNQVAENIVLVADQDMLGSIFRNLISNAIKFSRAGQEIVVKAEQNGDEVVVSVKDSGIGIPKKMLEGLFKIGAKNGRIGTDGEPTSGLGLMLVHDFTEKQGGSIKVISEEGKGTTFELTFNNKA